MPSYIFKPADFDRNSANVAALANTAGTNFDFATLDYDATTDEHADMNVQMDQFYDSGVIYLDVYWKAAATSGDVVWQLNIRGIASGELFDGTLGSDNHTTSTAQGTTEYLNKATITINSPGLSPNDIAIFRISRDADSTNDTDDMAGDAKLVVAVLRFEVSG